MTDVSLVVGATHQVPPQVRWAPLTGRGLAMPKMEHFGTEVPRVSRGDTINVVFDNVVPTYPRSLVALFTTCAIISILSLLGLLAAPLYARAVIITALLFGLAAGLGGLAVTVARAAHIRERR
jgi:hypothetical protein